MFGASAGILEKKRFYVVKHDNCMNVEKTYMPVVAIPLATLQIVHLFANTEVCGRTDYEIVVGIVCLGEIGRASCRERV